MSVTTTVYADKNDIKDILGLADITTIRDAFLTIAQTYIDVVMLNGDCQKHTNIPKRYDIDNNSINTVLLNYPILQINEIIDNANGSTPVTLLAANYDFNPDDGILFLLNEVSEISGGEVINYFTKGRQNLEVDYNYGYDSIPDDIHKFANELSAMICKSDTDSSESGSKVMEKIGNYQYQINIAKNVLARFSYLGMLEKALAVKYRKVFIS